MNRSPPSLAGWTKQFPIAVMGFLSGMFTGAYASYHTAPAISPGPAAGFAVLTGMAALAFCHVTGQGDGDE